MRAAEAKKQPEELDFNGAWLKNEDKIKPNKSIVICGITRGGTSFAASVFGRLGVPFSRRGERTIGARYEHRDLRDAFFGKEGDAIRKIATHFSKEYPVWAWKLPAIQREFEFVAELVPNPHFVIIFKEPLSVAARKTDLKGKSTLQTLGQVTSVYQHMASIAAKTEHPLLLVSYDRAVARLDSFLADAARFAGVTRFDMENVIAGIREDGQRYFKAGSEKSSPAAPAVKLDQPKLKAPKAPKIVPFSYL